MAIKVRLALAVGLLTTVGAGLAEQTESYDYWRPQRDMITQGVQALLMCNGLFTSNRTIEQVFDQELKYLPDAIGSAEGGDYSVSAADKTVAVGFPGGNAPVMRAAFREGLGCVILAPDQTFADADSFPELPGQAPPDPAKIPWPNGDLLSDRPLPAGVDTAALAAAGKWAFERPTPEQLTLSLLVVYQGELILERYADGVDMTTRTRTWSTAKSIAATLIGMLVDQGQLELDTPVDFDWKPETRGDEDPRHQVTLRDLLQMSSGLEPLDNNGMEYATGSGLSYWAGASAVQGALNRALIRQPGTVWDYENYDTILAVYAMKRVLGADYLTFPRDALLKKIGMTNTLLSTDRFGDFILSSQVYTNARDLARFGLLYLNGGEWEGERIISKSWIDFVTTPAPSTKELNGFYGGQWWLVPKNRSDVPKDAYSTAGNRGQFVIVAPSADLVIVRRGLDYGRQGFSNWDLLREVLRAFPEQ